MKEEYYTYCHKLLNDFFLSRCRDEHDFSSAINEFRLSHFFANSINSMTETSKNQLIKEREEQQNRYEIFEREISILSKMASANNIKLVFMKGLVLAKDLFNPVNLRKSKDMDLLIDYADLNHMDKLLRESGYYVNHEDTYTNTLYYVNKYKSIRDELTHLAQYHKKIKTNNNEEFIIDLDLHIHCCHYLPTNETYVRNSIISRSKTIHINENTEINILEEHDAFIHLCAHFVRHFYWEYFRFIRGKMRYELRHDLLFEMALFLRKHRDNISRNILLQRSKVLNQLEVVLLSLVLLDYIYVGLIDQKMLMNFKYEYENCSFDNGLSSEFVNAALNSNLEILTFSNNLVLANEIHEKIRNQKKVNDIYYKHFMSQEFNLREIYFNKNLVEVKDKEIIESSKLFKLLSDKKGQLKIAWDNNKLFGEILVPFAEELRKNKKILNLSLCKDENCCFFHEWSDSVPTNKFFNKTSKNYYVDDIEKKEIIRDGVDHFVNCSDVLIDYEYKTDYLKIIFSILWENAEILPFVRRIIGFQINLDYENDSEEVAYLRYTFEDDSKYQYGLFHPWTIKYSRLKLIK